ncbi:MAG: c-type cytochrome [Mariprofundaceae bacterium]
MRLLFGSVSVVVVIGLMACQQQEPNSASKAEQSKTAAVAKPTVKSESIEVVTPEVVSEAVEKIVEKLPTESAVIASVDESAKAVEKAANREVSVQSTASKPATVAPVLKAVAEAPAKTNETVAVKTAKISEITELESAEKVSGDSILGAKVAKKCAACHTFNQGGKNKTGPNLFGVMGRIKGSVPGFKYGSYLKAENGSGAIWNEASLRGWVENSKAVAKAAGSASKMPAQKITGEKANNLIAYLKTL